MTVTAEQPGNASLPSVEPTLQLRDIIRTIPKECFQKDSRKAWFSVLVSVLAAIAGYATIAFSPWFLLPLAWIFTGTALTGWFVIAHDCGHRSFAKQVWVNDWVGHFFMLPLLYPFHSWRIFHNHHHLHTNKLLVDNAWSPWLTEDYQAASPWLQIVYKYLRGYLWWLSSIPHWLALHFNPALADHRERGKVTTSVAIVIGFAALLLPTLLWTVGPWGLVKFWLMPWLVYHFWMSTFTLVHHTIPEVKFRPAESWHEADAQLAGTVHCDYPMWVEWLCHDINVHVPHHISTAIPSYNLRMAHRSLMQNWGDYIQTKVFSWSLMSDIVERCHLYHPENGYQSFSEFEKTRQHH